MPAPSSPEPGAPPPASQHEQGSSSLAPSARQLPDRPTAASEPRSTYDYALVRLVPRVERAEFVNVGAIVHCRQRRFLAARVLVDEPRLRALWPGLDLAEVGRHLEALVAIAGGGEGAGPIGRLPATERFHWLVAPRSTMVQPSPVHAGLCDDPEAALEDLMARLVRLSPPSPLSAEPRQKKC